MKRVVAIGAVLVALAVAVLLVAGGDHRARVRVQLENASGLRLGSPVKVGGAKVGSVERFGFDDGDRVIAYLDVQAQTTIGRGATAAVRTANLLGEKYLFLDPGDTTRPAAPGTLIPAARTSYPTDLDQVLGVLDAPTRARLGILVNEAGLALTGRKQDLNDLLGQLPPGMDLATDLLNRLVADNRSLAEVIDHADTFLARIVQEQPSINRAVDNTAALTAAIAPKAQQLEAGLDRLPATLSALRTFLADLESTTVPLGPAAGALADTAPRLTETLAALPAFGAAAVPALEEARGLSPQLTALAADGTPVVRRLAPALGTLARFSRTVKPLTDTVDVAIDDTLGTAEGWARSIQARDGIGHVFRGRAVVSTDAMRAFLAKLETPAPPSRRVPPKRTRPTRTGSAPAVQQPSTPARKPLDDLLRPAAGLVPGIVEGLGDTTTALDHGLRDQIAPILDYLLKP